MMDHYWLYTPALWCIDTKYTLLYNEIVAVT